MLCSDSATGRNDRPALTQRGFFVRQLLAPRCDCDYRGRHAPPQMPGNEGLTPYGKSSRHSRFCCVDRWYHLATKSRLGILLEKLSDSLDRTRGNRTDDLCNEWLFDDGSEGSFRKRD
jgi:hypothetical protein